MRVRQLFLLLFTTAGHRGAGGSPRLAPARPPPRLIEVPVRVYLIREVMPGIAEAGVAWIAGFNERARLDPEDRHPIEPPLAGQKDEAVDRFRGRLRHELASDPRPA